MLHIEVVTLVEVVGDLEVIDFILNRVQVITYYGPATAMMLESVTRGRLHKH